MRHTTFIHLSDTMYALAAIFFAVAVVTWTYPAVMKTMCLGAIVSLLAAVVSGIYASILEERELSPQTR